jgi:hypothetical protein
MTMHSTVLLARYDDTVESLKERLAEVFDGDDTVATWIVKPAGKKIELSIVHNEALGELAELLEHEGLYGIRQAV